VSPRRRLTHGTAPAAVADELLHAYAALHACVDELREHLEEACRGLRGWSTRGATAFVRGNAVDAQPHLVLPAQPARGLLLVLRRRHGGGREERRRRQGGRREGGRALGLWLGLDPHAGAGHVGGGGRDLAGGGDGRAREGLCVEAVDALAQRELEGCARVVHPVLLLLVERREGVEEGGSVLVVWVWLSMVQLVDVRLVRDQVVVSADGEEGRVLGGRRVWRSW